MSFEIIRSQKSQVNLYINLFLFRIVFRRKFEFFVFVVFVVIFFVFESQARLSTGQISFAVTAPWRKNYNNITPMFSGSQKERKRERKRERKKERKKERKNIK